MYIKTVYSIYTEWEYILNRVVYTSKACDCSTEAEEQENILLY